MSVDVKGHAMTHMAKDTSSDLAAARLSTGALVQELSKDQCAEGGAG